MSARLTFPITPAANEGTFAAGWNARTAGKIFRPGETVDWKLGWKTADAVRDGERRPFNDTAPVSRVRRVGRAA